MKTALVLVTLGVFHPGFAMFVVGLATLGMALELARDLDERPALVPVPEAGAEPPSGRGG